MCRLNVPRLMPKRHALVTKLGAPFPRLATVIGVVLQ
jgi:hypothetical protein